MSRRGRDQDYSWYPGDYDQIDYKEKPFVEYDELLKIIEENNIDNFIDKLLVNDFDYQKVFLKLLSDDSKQQYLKVSFGIIAFKFREKLDDYFISELYKAKKIYLVEHLLNGEIDKLILSSNAKSKDRYKPIGRLFNISAQVIKIKDYDVIMDLIPYFANFLDTRDLAILSYSFIKYTNDISLLDYFIKTYHKNYPREIYLHNINEFFKQSIKLGNRQYVEYFVSLGCKIKDNVNYFSDIEVFDKDVVKYLLENGADIYSYNGRKKVPDLFLTNIIKCLL